MISLRLQAFRSSTTVFRTNKHRSISARQFSTMALLGAHEKRHKVTVVGSGNWGSVVTKIIAENAIAHPDLFEPDVEMWVFEETYTLPKESKHYDSSSEMCTKPQKLTELINHFHENVKYLPDVALPKNIHANPSIVDAVKDSTILVFNLPHQFLARTCKEIVGKIVPYARGISCIKGVSVSKDDISLFSEVIGSELGIYVGALSGANIANEVGLEKWSGTTVAYDPPPMDSRNPTPKGPSPVSSQLDLTAINEKATSGGRKRRLQPLPSEYPPLDHKNLKSLFHRPYFHVRVVSDVTSVSLAGALKNIVALAAGFVSGLGWGDNAKSEIVRVGLLEMVKFGPMFFENAGINPETIMRESAGVADLVTSCSSGRNFRCAKMSVERNVSVQEIEKSELNGQILQGVGTAEEVNAFLKAREKEDEFPLFTAVYRILHSEAKPKDIPDLIEMESQGTPPGGHTPRN